MNTAENMKVIYAYTRKQAITDGVLVDAGPMANEAGIKFPVALTQGVYGEYVEVPDGVEGQDVAGRLWDILWMLRHAIIHEGKQGSEILFKLYVRNYDTRRSEKDCRESADVCNPQHGPGVVDADMAEY